jgi:hypothetical protein
MRVARDPLRVTFPGMTWRRWWPLAVLPFLLSFLACSSSSTCQPGAVSVFVELPDGTDSVSSFEATGACAPDSGGCAPLTARCETAKCDCQQEVQVNETTIGAGQTGICHLRVIAKTGAVFTKDLTFTSPVSSCFDVSGPSGIVRVDFADAGIADAGIADGGHADGGHADADADAAD